MAIYIINENPMTCPKCGARTDFFEIDDYEMYTEHHTCLNEDCEYEFDVQEG